METKVTLFENVPLIIPVIYGIPMEFAQTTFLGYPSRCGAGEGIGDVIVPETILFLSISPSCHIHDNMWDIAEPTWADFHYANSVFLNNILSIVRERSDNAIIEGIRNYRAVSFYNAVNTIGVNVFWKLKKDQGEDISGRYFMEVTSERKR